MSKRKSPYDKGYPERSKDVFVTQTMLFAVGDELRSDIKTSTLSLKSEFSGLRSEFIGLKSEMQEVKSVVEQLNARFHYCIALIEEQNARNAVVMDGLTALFGRQDRVEKRVDDVEKTISTFRK